MFDMEENEGQIIREETIAKRVLREILLGLLEIERKYRLS
jgi:hypothetical protein